MDVLVLVGATDVLVGVGVAVRLRDDRRGQAGDDQADRGLHDCWGGKLRKKCNNDTVADG